MPVSTTELADAKAITTALLEALQLEAYLFEIEPGEQAWELRVECAVDDGWQTITLLVDKEELLNSNRSPELHRQLLAKWRGRLQVCRAARR